ncbi:MAG: hypothetical protein RLZZ591_1199 [Pseudomonadota bacterium]|jgi:serine/threonine protein phosphatase PrpC
MKFSVFQLSRQGGREKNEDRMGYCYCRDSALFLLADGMGGHPQGEVAAHLALKTMSSMYREQSALSAQEAPAFLKAALMAAHDSILRHALEQDLKDSPRTTLVAALLHDGRVSWVHCGDSRFYLVRDGTLQARTRDHSYSEQRMGAPGSAAAGAGRHVLYTCLGSALVPEFDVVGPVRIDPEDQLLLCSDGLWDNLHESVILNWLRSKPLHEAVPALVSSALEQGGPNCDNVTALAVQWHAPDSAIEAGVGYANTLRPDAFASTFLSDGPDMALMAPAPLDEAAIDRTVQEINDAIRRASRKT